MKVKIFDFEHEIDLETAINSFISNKVVISILYQTSHFQSLNEQVFSFSALILYEWKKSFVSNNLIVYLLFIIIYNKYVNN